MISRAAGEGECPAICVSRVMKVSRWPAESRRTVDRVRLGAGSLCRTCSTSPLTSEVALSSQWDSRASGTTSRRARASASSASCGVPARTMSSGLNRSECARSVGLSIHTLPKRARWRRVMA